MIVLSSGIRKPPCFKLPSASSIHSAQYYFSREFAASSSSSKRRKEWEGKWNEMVRGEEKESENSAPSRFNWFPGHMYSASQSIYNTLQEGKVTLVVEVRDARAPFSSGNDMLESISMAENRLIVFNKSDLSNPNLNTRVLEQVANQYPNTPSLYVNVKNSKSVRQLAEMCLKLCKSTQTKPDEQRMLVVGVPNVGKSSIVNQLRKEVPNLTKASKKQGNRELEFGYSNTINSPSAIRLQQVLRSSKGDLPFSLGEEAVEKARSTAAAKVGPLPGVTRRIGGFHLSPRLICLDSPGIMLPKISSPDLAFKLSIIGCLKDNLLGEYMISDYLIQFLQKHNPSIISDFYGIPCNTDDVDMVLDEIAKSRGSLLQGASPNRHFAACTLLRDFRQGSLGVYVLDSV